MTNKETIKLKFAHVTQHTNGAIKSDWKIEENETNKILGILPKRLNHNEVFSILDFARKYEAEAFNLGKTFNKINNDKIRDTILKQYEDKLNEVRMENERLAEALEIITNK